MCIVFKKLRFTLFNYGKLKKHFYKNCYGNEISFNSRLLNLDNYLYGMKSKALNIEFLTF